MTRLDRPSTFLNASFDEAVALCHETRSYFDRLYQRDCQGLSGQERLFAGRKAMQLTVTVTQVLAWLMAYKSKEGFNETMALLPGFALAGPPFDGGANSGPRQDSVKLPRKLGELLDRSDSLCLRIARLEAAAAQRH